MKRLFAGFAAMFILWTGSVAAAEPIVSYRLENGLDVVLAPDRRVPKVVMNLRYRVGSMNEPAGRSGFAHLFEHLMFSGTAAWPNVFEAHSAVGNTINAWTMEDGTVYYVEGLSANLPMILSLEADRMANLGGEVSQAELDLQRSVVKNEMRQNVLDQAGASAWQAFWSGLFAKPHPYSRTVIGSVADLDAAALSDVRGFFDTYYVPNNAVLVLTGDFQTDDARALVADTFGRVPRGAEVPSLAAPTVAPAGLRLVLEDRVPSPIVLLGYTGPKGDAPENGALALAAEILGDPETGMLRQRLVGEKRVATYASASWTPGLLSGRFTIEATAAPGTPADTLEAELRAALHDLVSQPVDAADFARARRSLLLDARVGAESLKDRAGILIEQAATFGRVTYGLEDNPAIAQSTVEATEAALRAVVRRERESTLILGPGPRGAYPDVLLESSGTPDAFKALPRTGTDIPKLPPREPGTAVLPAQQTATLPNGIRIVHYDMPEAPVASLAVVAATGWYSAPPGREGLLEIATAMAVRGAGDRRFEAFARAAGDAGARISYRADTMATGLTLAVPAETFDDGVSLLADAVLKPRFDAAEWTVAKAEYADWFAGRQADLPDVALRAAREVLFPGRNGVAGPNWTAQSIARITLDDAKAAFAALFQPAAVTIYSTGPLPLETVRASAEKWFGNRGPSGQGLVARPHPSARFPVGRTVLFLSEPGASQSALLVARPAPGVGEPGRGEAVAVSNLLGGHFNSRLNAVIREEKGYSYGVSSYLFDDIDAASVLAVATTVERDSTGPALAEIFKGFESLASAPVTDGEVNRTVTAYRQAVAGVAETSSGLFEALMMAVGSGTTLEDNHRRREERTRLTRHEVAAEAGKLASLEPSLIIVAGDADLVLPQLTAMGLTDIRRIDQPRPVTQDRDAPMAQDDTQPIPPLTGTGEGPGSTRSVHPGQRSH